MSVEIMVGLIAIAIAIGVGLAPIVYILRKENQDLIEVKDEIEKVQPIVTDLISSSIDDKISNLFRYENMVRSWGHTEGNRLERESKMVHNRMKSDIRVLTKLKSYMTPDQREISNLQINTLIKELRNYAQPNIADEIDSAYSLLK